MLHYMDAMDGDVKSNIGKTPPRLTLCLLFKIFIISTCGMALSLNLYYAGLKYVSATFSTVANNTIPAMVFILAICLRMETMSITQKQGLAKIVGSALCLGGAMVFTFYKGPDLYAGVESDSPHAFAKRYTKEEWIKGSLLTLAAFFVWAVWLIVQTPILREYPSTLRLTTLQCWFSCVTSAIYAAAVERQASSWKLGWNVNLLTVIFCGILVTGVTNSLQVWVVGKSGPVFTAIFSPLSLILTAIFSALIFHESLHWGSVLGGVMLIGGLYAFLWGKNREDKAAVDASTAEVGLESIVASQPSDDNQQQVERDALKI
ncbi:WAT1-related protein At1g43650-like isoform X2 [Andrographis paniculata]|uniref:WAT1-related protein At1g43650-like isoform X2 n=1 Tax=Andrographis paniculata TaxID=175694 RepID=UPI0021E8DCAD|nr:WAT1-related protein At1g43650-like isoform X2 [Andrographis paniculata]XP_051143585.1 WAT1-related protein At1g43650-like isoform X2 [Andrographis paniculata]XP_051143586.1 WAT1-related protein At1g43650-like isoform X2 [Andrographis paniculata]XP_051143587.1 WAT1-related protein At1g43650-like isoform X2 [Andrographis paniculata]